MQMVRQFNNCEKKKRMVCLNDGKSSRLDVHTGNTSTLDVNLVSRNLAEIFEWDVSEETTVGSDHFPLFCSLSIEINAIISVFV